MRKIIKYKIITLFEDKIFNIVLLIYFIVLNYNIFINSGLFLAGSAEFNSKLKYTLLINNFIATTSMFGLLTAIYIGAGFIGKDIKSNQIYVILSSTSKRWAYFFGNWIGSIVVIFVFLSLIILNYICISAALGVMTYYIDFLTILIETVLNMIVIMTITAAASIFIEGYGSALVGFIALTIYNIHSACKIPFTNHFVNVDFNLRRLLVNISPIRSIYASSITSEGVIERFNVEPFLIHNFTAYQMLYIGILLIIGIFALGNREL